MRQTDLSFEELMHYFHNLKKSPYPPCLIVNEIGNFALIGDTRASKALVDFLKNSDAEVRYAACCWIDKCAILMAKWPLEELLKTEKDQRVFNAAQNALSKLKLILRSD